MVLLFPATGKAVSTECAGIFSQPTCFLCPPCRFVGIGADHSIGTVPSTSGVVVRHSIPPVALWLTAGWQSISGWLQSVFGQLNPLYPPHYLQMAKTSLRAVANNNWKVELLMLFWFNRRMMAWC